MLWFVYEYDFQCMGVQFYYYLELVEISKLLFYMYFNLEDSGLKKTHEGPGEYL